MAEDTSLYLLTAVAVVAVIGLGISIASFATDRSVGNMMGTGGGGMMNGSGGTGAGGPGLLEWAVLILSIAFFAIAVVLLLRGRSVRQQPAAPAPQALAATSGPGAPTVPIGPIAPVAAVAAREPEPPAAAVAEPTLVKLLDEDERRMYLEIRGHGGEMLQRDLVALGIFSKAKVTRVLDKLERKGLVVREAHGMTNRVRLTGGASR